MSRSVRSIMASAILLALATSCQALARVASTLELGYVDGSGSSSGAFGGSLSQPGMYGQPGSLEGDYSGDSDFHAWTFSVRPLAALEPPREVVIVNVAALAAGAIGDRGPDEPAVILEPAPVPPPAPTYRTFHCAGCCQVVTEAGGSDPHECRSPAQPLVEVSARTPRGVTITVDGEPLVELDPLEPFKGPAPDATPPSQPNVGKAVADPKECADAGLSVWDIAWPTSWAALGALLLYLLPHVIRFAKALRAKESA